MTGETLRQLLEPLIGKSGSISMVVSRIGHIGIVLFSASAMPEAAPHGPFRDARRVCCIRVDARASWPRMK